MAAAEALAAIGPKAAPAVPALVAAAGAPGCERARPARVRRGSRRDRAGGEGGAAGAPPDRGEAGAHVGGRDRPDADVRGASGRSARSKGNDPSRRRASRPRLLWLRVAAGVAVLALTLLSAAGVIPIAGTRRSSGRSIFRFGLVLLAGVFVGRRPRGRGGAGERSAEPRISEPRLRGLALPHPGPVHLHGARVSRDRGREAPADLDEMRAFFVASGYSAGSSTWSSPRKRSAPIGLLVPSVRLVAASGLALVMMGAVFTHTQNGDPLERLVGGPAHARDPRDHRPDRRSARAARRAARGSVIESGAIIRRIRAMKRLFAGLLLALTAAALAAQTGRGQRGRRENPAARSRRRTSGPSSAWALRRSRRTARRPSSPSRSGRSRRARARRASGSWTSQAASRAG